MPMVSVSNAKMKMYSEMLNAKDTMQTIEVRGIVNRINQPLPRFFSGMAEKDQAAAKAELETYLRKPETIRSFRALPPDQQKGIASLLGEVQ